MVEHLQRPLIQLGDGQQKQQRKIKEDLEELEGIVVKLDPKIRR